MKRPNHSIAHECKLKMYALRLAIGDEAFDKIIERARELVKLADQLTTTTHN